MKYHRLNLIYLVSLYAICLVGCTMIPSTRSTEVLPSTSRVTELATSPHPTPIIHTPVPTPVSPICTPAASPVPTLTVDEALTFIRQMQVTNGGCELPCWWGITPGKTTWEETQQVFALLREYKSVRSSIGAIGVGFPKYSGFDASVYSGDGTVEEIWVFGSLYGTDGSGRLFPFDNSWQPYSLSEVLEHLGIPSQVMVGFEPDTVEEDDKWYYELHVFYDELGLIIRYEGPATLDSKHMRGCFSLDQLTDIRLYSRVPWPGGFQGPPWDYGIDPEPLEQASDLSLEEFYERFQYDGACLESPANFWLSTR